jgi:hypothetical protein
MVPIACLMHWYISMMFVVPVLAVVGWCWLSGRRYARRNGGDSGASPTQQAAGSLPN